MENNILLSIVIPLYNVEKYIARCLNSILDQLVDQVEIIIVDDGSRDSSAEICEQYCRKYKEVRIVHQKNQGLSAARNTGISYANGEFISFVDSDDLVTNRGIESLLVLVKKNEEADVIASPVSLLVDNEIIESTYKEKFSELNYVNRDNVYEELYKIPGIIVGAWMFTIRRTFLDRHQLFFKSGIFHEDEEWIPRVFLNANNIVFNSNSVYIYRINRENSIIHSLNMKKELDKLEIVDCTIKYMENYNNSSETIAIKNKMCNLIYSILCNSIAYKGNKGYQELLVSLKIRMEILKSSKIRTYRLLWAIYRIFGIRVCAAIAHINTLREKK